MPFENIEEYLLAEKACEGETISNLKEPVELHNEIFEYYIIISKKYGSGHPKVPNRPIAVIILNYRILKSIACLLTLIKKGQYAEFQSILRDIFEALSKCEYMIKHPEISESWMKGDRINFSKVSKQLSFDNSLNELYGDLCNFTHANAPASKWEITIHPKNFERDYHAITISSKPVFRKDIAYYLIMLLISFTIYAIKNYTGFIEIYYNGIDNADTIEYQRLIKKVELMDIDYKQFSADPKNTEWRTKVQFKSTSDKGITDS